MTSWPQALADISFFVNHASSLHPTVPLYLFGHSMGGALSIAFATRTPPSPALDKLKGVIASSPLLRQAKGVKAPALIVRAGGLLGKLSSTLTLKAEVKPQVRSSGMDGRDGADAESRTSAVIRSFRRRTPSTLSVSLGQRSKESRTCFSGCVLAGQFLEGGS